jgi:signal transduction histidine kinase
VTLQARTGELTVSDTGPGLADEDLHRAFERFYLHDRYRSNRPVGSGLGLAIVKQLIVASGGTVQADHADGGGARFVVRLPTP